MAVISNTPRPGYVWDSTDNVWYPIGTGPHTHADYITSGSAINPNIVDAKGDIIAATAADTVARLAVGSNNQVLTADSSTATGLKWATPAAGGKVLQVVEGTTSTSVNSSSTSYTDTNLTATITPSSASSKVLVLVSQGGIAKSAANIYMYLRLMRDATSINSKQNLYTSSTDEQKIEVSIIKLDSPATTSAVTYKTQFNNASGTGTITVNGDSDSSIILMEIGA